MREELGRRRGQLRAEEAARAGVEARLAKEFAFRARLHEALEQLAQTHGHPMSGGHDGGDAHDQRGGAPAGHPDGALTELLVARRAQAEAEAQRFHAELADVLSGTDRARDVRRAHSTLTAFSSNQIGSAAAGGALLHSQQRKGASVTRQQPSPTTGGGP